jgi:phosphoenolpyruvate-protein kinase (PTS system EI component)
LGIPAVAEIPGLLEKIRQDDLLLVDGFSGKVAINPEAETADNFRGRAQIQASRRVKQQKECHEPATTLDGITVQVMANVGCREDIQLAAENGTDGIGLFRLEEFYLSRKNPPSEEELIEEITYALHPVAGKPATIRLLDAGGDKKIPFLEMPYEANPFLGRRGVRLLLEYPELANTQLRAILQSGTEDEIAIMAPMITLTREMKQLRNLLTAAAMDLGIDNLPALGAMVETPVAALCADEIGRHSDFVSIGTNDLTQYTMAAGRENPLVSRYFIDDHPAILKMIHMITQGLGDKPVAVCGELAANLDVIPTLLEKGIRSLSVSPPLIPSVKEIIRQTRLPGPGITS